MLNLRCCKLLASHLIKRPLNHRTVTILQDGNGKNNNKMLCSAIKVSMENSNSPLPFREIDKTNFINYQFPLFRISYDQNDVVEHAKSVGVQPGEEFSDLYLDEWNKKLQVLPSFLFPFTNKVFLDTGLERCLLFDKTVHGEHYMHQIRQLPPKGTIDLELKILDTLDKGVGTLYAFRFNGYDHQNGDIYFEQEYQFFEIGTGGFNGKKSNPHLTRTVEPSTDSEPDCVLQFSAFVPEGGFKSKMSNIDITEISTYSPLHPRQYYSDDYDFLPRPVAHGRWTFAAAIKMILFKYGHGNVERFKSAKVRFAEPVYLDENMEISLWKEDSRILFRGDVQRNGKITKALSGGYVDLEL